MKSLSNEKYLSLVTFRKTGKEIPTPVWFAPDGDKLYVFTMADSGKVKRLRNSPRSRIAACDIRGKVHGEWMDTKTRILGEVEEQEKARRALRRKYRVQMLISDLFGRDHRPHRPARVSRDRASLTPAR